MELEQTTASVIAYVLGSLEAPGVTPYLDTIPEGFAVPAAFFEPERTEGRGFTLEMFRIDHTMYVVMFGRNIREAMAMAQSAQLAICARRHMVPIINEDAKPTGDYVHIRKVDANMLSAEEATAQLALRWQTTGGYLRDGRPGQRIMHVNINTYIKR